MKILKITITFLAIIAFAGNIFSQEENSAKFLGISNEKLNNTLENNENSSSNKAEKKKKKKVEKIKSISSKLQTKVITTKTEKKEKILVFEELEGEILENRDDSLVYFASQFLGTKYRYGGMSPKTGFDCSGFVGYVFLNFDVKLPRSSKDFGKLENQIETEDCQKGDILVFAGGNPQKRPIGHVALVISTENNDIEFIHASTGKKSIIITKLSESKYYQQRLVTIVRK